MVRNKRRVEIGQEEAGASNLGDSAAAKLLIAAGSMEVGQGKRGDRQSYGAIFDEREIVLLQGVSMVRE